MKSHLGWFKVLKEENKVARHIVGMLMMRLRQTKKMLRTMMKERDELIKAGKVQSERYEFVDMVIQHHSTEKTALHNACYNAYDILFASKK